MRKVELGVVEIICRVTLNQKRKPAHAPHYIAPNLPVQPEGHALGVSHPCPVFPTASFDRMVPIPSFPTGKITRKLPAAARNGMIGEGTINETQFRPLACFSHVLSWGSSLAAALQDSDWWIIVLVTLLRTSSGMPPQ
jgi:hypothetical protein